MSPYPRSITTTPALSRRARTLVGSLALLALVACQGSQLDRLEPTRFQSQEEAGSGHLAVLSIAPWSDYVEALQPEFKMTPDMALAQSAATAFQTERKLRDLVSVVAKVGLPGSTTEKTTETITSTPETPADADAGAAPSPVTNSTTTEIEKTVPGAVPEFTPNFSTDSGAQPCPSTDALGVDAVMQHTLATALYQEVQLLNRYVRDVAIRDGYKPYVVRLQVSLMPRTRTAPYDAYTTVAVFPAPKEGGLEPDYAMQVGAARTRTTTADAVGRRTEYDCVDRCRRPTACKTPIVMPLLVTDNVEGMVAAQSSDTVRQYALALGGMIQNVAASAEMEKLAGELVSSAGRDYNSLLTVSRLTENTIRVRMGAKIHSTGQYFAVPQTRYVTLLVFVDDTVKPRSALSVFARTEFVDADTGKSLLMRTGARLARRKNEIFQSSSTLRFIQQADREQVFNEAMSNDYAGFLKEYSEAYWHLDEKPFRKEAIESRAQQAWLILSAITVGSQFSAQEVTLPDPVREDGLELDKAVAGFDDGQQTLRVTVPFAPKGRRKAYGATLLIYEDEPADKAAPDPAKALHIVPAIRVVPYPAAGVMQADFPSLARLLGSHGSLLTAALRGCTLLRLSQLDPNAGGVTPVPHIYEVKLAVYTNELPRPGSSIEIDSLSDIVTDAGGILTLDLSILRKSGSILPPLSVAVAVEYEAEGHDAQPIELTGVTWNGKTAKAADGKFLVTVPGNADRVVGKIVTVKIQKKGELKIHAQAMGDAVPTLRVVKVTPPAKPKTE